MAKKNKLWFSGEDAQLAARFTKFMTKVLYARRASYIRAVMVKAKHEISIEECRDEVDTVYEHQLANYPDVLTVAQVCEVTGYQRHTILKWCSKGLLKTILQTPKYMIPKVWLLEFVTSDFFNEISRKCGKHYAAIKEISSLRKAR